MGGRQKDICYRGLAAPQALVNVILWHWQPKVYTYIIVNHAELDNIELTDSIFIHGWSWWKSTGHLLTMVESLLWRVIISTTTQKNPKQSYHFTSLTLRWAVALGQQFIYMIYKKRKFLAGWSVMEGSTLPIREEKISVSGYSRDRAIFQ